MVKVIGGAQEGEFKAVASGTLPNGKPVVVNSDGTVSVVGETPISQAVGSATTFESAITNFVSSAFDSNSNKLVISYRDQSNSLYGTAVVGTVSGTAISFGTPVVFFSGSTNATSTAFDSNSNKIVVSYRDSAASNNGKAVVGTVSGTSISFGSATQFESGATQFISSTFDSSNNKIVVAFEDESDTENGKAVVGTVSGTSISFGSATTFETGSVKETAIAFDSLNGKIVVSYIDTSDSNKGKAVVGTVSGTSISFGTEAVFTANQIQSRTRIAYDSSNSKLVICYDNDTNSTGEAVVATVNGTSITFGTTTVFSSSAVSETSIVFDSTSNQFIIATQYGDFFVGSVSGTNITFGSAVEFDSSTFTSYPSVSFDSSTNKTIVSYAIGASPYYGKSVVFQPAYDATNLTSENYIGMSSGAVTPSVNGTKTSFNSSAIGSEVTGSVYDPDTGKIIICYTRGSDNHGLAVVGTVSGTTLSFGTPVVFNAAVTDHTDITYDTANNKVLIVYKNVGNNNYGTAIVGTVSGTSISFGTPVVYFSARSHNNKATFDTNAGKSLVVWLDDDNNDVESAVATISGTNVSFGSIVTVDANANSNEVVFDSNSNKVVVVYKDLGNSNYGTAIVGTISGTSVSFGSEVVFNAGSTSDIHCAFDSTNNKVIISFKAGSDGDKAKAIVGTVSGTSISFGSLATINDAASQQPKPVYNSVQQELIFEYELSGNGLYYRTASVSGTSIVNIGSQVTLASGFDALVSNLVYHPTENVAVVGFKDSGDSNKGNAIAFSTEVRGEVASGGAATVDIIGSLSTNQGSLTAGQQYFVQTDGTIGLTAADPSVLAGTAISATELLVKT